MLSGAKACQSCRSRQELSNEYLVFTCKIRLRYSRERASQSLPKIRQKLEKKLEPSKVHTEHSHPLVFRASDGEVVVPDFFFPPAGF